MWCWRIDYQGLILKEIFGTITETYYFNNGTLDFGYRFDYTNRDVDIYMVGNDLQSVSQNYRLNQVELWLCRKLRQVNK
jgi:hypothetical protein